MIEKHPNLASMDSSNSFAEPPSTIPTTYPAQPGPNTCMDQAPSPIYTYTSSIYMFIV